MGLMDDKVAIVTGAGRGIGRGEAIELAREGAAVVVGEVDEAAAQAVVDEIREAGGSATAGIGDCSDTDVAASLVQTAVEEFGHLDALVNNAGILRDRTLVKMTADEWDAVVAVHLRGHYAMTQAACAYWKDNSRPGHIVCTASTSGLLGNFGQSNYGAAKAGIATFSTIVALEMKRYDVTCNAIAPAARTRMTEGAYGEIERDESEFDFWHPDNVAPFVTYLCSDAASHISGKVFGVQGDAVEIYQPYTSVSFISNGGRRWEPSQFVSAAATLFDESGIAAEVENPMRRLRFSMTQRS
ncbi:MAG: SDR family NAD(P)-dependent oxidoreductase [Frankiaceae bacterium]|nr:SDR family NAD(P)-dependent oxidoreductase [Frankiaceae bacterium]MBV9871263.1 SDR family NAD(P)-dependent oxidoreductase [Frankiaceae bacterium]